MNKGLKQRVVGAIVLVALSIILWPIFMGGGEERQMVIETTIPKPPEFEKFEIETAESNPEITPIGSYEESLTKSERQPTPSDDAKVLDNHGLPTAWAIQIGLFADKTNVARLEKELRAEKYKVFSQGVTTDGKIATKLFVGPFVELAEANKLQQAINSKHNLQSTVIKFVP